VAVLDGLLAASLNTPPGGQGFQAATRTMPLMITVGIAGPTFAR